MRQVDILVAEIGSTTTVVNAFSGWMISGPSLSNREWLLPQSWLEM